jgi:hypothetical protein
MMGRERYGYGGVGGIMYWLCVHGIIANVDYWTASRLVSGAAPVSTVQWYDVQYYGEFFRHTPCASGRHQYSTRVEIPNDAA